jgi:hypothetical protein
MLALSGGSGGLRAHEMGPSGLAATQHNVPDATPVEQSLITKQHEEASKNYQD